MFLHNFAIVALLLAIYFLPSIIAYSRGHASKMAILFVNILGGWTLLLWVWILIWSLANKGQSITINNTVSR